MLEFNDPEDAFVVNGRGVCFSSGRWKLPDGMWEPGDLTGETVILAGAEVKVRGVEAFCIARSPSSPYRLPFALLVSFDDAKKVDIDAR
jgi:hypothetical protein